jgi:hypothetical protein
MFLSKPHKTDGSLKKCIDLGCTTLYHFSLSHHNYKNTLRAFQPIFKHLGHLLAETLLRKTLHIRFSKKCLQQGKGKRAIPIRLQQRRLPM